MKVDKNLVEKVAKNSRLNLTDKEIKEFVPQLQEVFDNFSKLAEVKTDNVDIAIQPVELKNKFREDKVVKGLSQAEALKNSKNNKNGFFKGPKAI